MNSENWILILQQEKMGIIKENQWKISGFLVFIIPFLLLIVLFFINKEDPIIPRIFGGIILSLILFIIIIASVIVPVFLFWEALVKVNAIDKLKNEIIIEKVKDENEIIKKYENIIQSIKPEDENKRDY